MEVWQASDDVMKTIKVLIANHHPDLVAVEDEIAVLFREKASKAGDDKVFLGKSKKAPAILSVLSDTKWKFIIELAWDQWEDLNDKERLALLDHHLCALRTEEDETSGEIKKCWIQPPDVVFYKDEVERHGSWRTGHSKPPDTTLIEEIFGSDDDD